MSYSALQDTPIVVNTLIACNDTGWTEDGVTATHSSCNSGSITNLYFPVIANQSYQVSYAVLSISGGYVQLQSPGSNGVEQTSANLYVETITPTSNGFVSFYSNANCQIQSFNIRNSTQDIGTTIAYSTINNKWSDFRTYYPDWGWSLFDRTVTAYQGALYSSDNGSANRNNFFGVQGASSITFIANQNPTQVKTYKSINLQSNELMITTANGITTSLGQVSELIAEDWLKYELSSIAGTIDVYTKEGVFSAQFLRDANTDLLTGDPLKGNWVMIGLEQSDGSVALQLYTVGIVDKISKIGVR